MFAPRTEPAACVFSGSVSAHASVLQLCLPSQLFVFIHNLADGVEAPSEVRCISVSACSISDIQHSTARSTPTDISLAIISTRSVGIAVVAKKLPAFPDSCIAAIREEGPPQSLPFSLGSITHWVLVPSELPARAPAYVARTSAPAW